MNAQLTFEQVAKALRDYFTVPSYSPEVYLILMLPAIFAAFWLFYGMRKASPRISHKPKDIDFFEMVRQQKGLENFDRELLMDLAEICKFSPAYKILLDEAMFNKALKILHKGISSGDNFRADVKQKFDYLTGLKKRLFTEDKDKSA